MTGKLAGVQVTTTNGAPGAEIVIRIRDGGSITQDNSPLYIIDGFPAVMEAWVITNFHDCEDFDRYNNIIGFSENFRVRHHAGVNFT